jgi:hypothetical protein
MVFLTSDMFSIFYFKNLCNLEKRNQGEDYIMKKKKIVKIMGQHEMSNCMKHNK